MALGRMHARAGRGRRPGRGADAGEFHHPASRAVGAGLSRDPGLTRAGDHTETVSAEPADTHRPAIRPH